MRFEPIAKGIWKIIYEPGDPEFSENKENDSDDRRSGETDAEREWRWLTDVPTEGGEYAVRERDRKRGRSYYW
jgi:PAB1-binding protein PBP1